MCEPQQQTNPVGPGTPTQAPEPETTEPPKSFRERMMEGLRAQRDFHEKAAEETREAIAMFEGRPDLVDAIGRLAKLGVMVGRSTCPF